MIRCVVFDFDGTLVDSNTIKRQAFLRIAARDSEEALMKDILASESGDRYAIFRKFAAACAGGDSQQRAHQLAQEYTSYCEKAVATCPEMRGASVMLEELKREGLQLALNSATPTDALTAIVARRGWQNYFTYVLGSPASKAANLAYIVDALSLENKEVVMVGDRRADQSGASEFDCPFIGVICADSDFEAPPLHAVNALAQLSSEIRRLQA
jgi:phosphoglycolate phosphatase